MFLSDFSIKRPLVTVVITVGLMIVGWMALTKLRVNERPDISPPVLRITIPYPGSSPETVERLKAAGSQVEYTMKNGAITVETDGKKLKIGRFRKD